MRGLRHRPTDFTFKSEPGITWFSDISTKSDSNVTGPVAVVDLFSGPGGLGEGFSASVGRDGAPQFRIAVSIEKEASAHRTLRLRAFLRQFDQYPPEYYDWLNGQISEPTWHSLYPHEWAVAGDEARCLELGSKDCASFLADRIAQIRSEHGDRTMLIGGPPCQAYSLVGRARNSGIAGYDPKTDQRNFLYDEYVKVLEALLPAVFVMENVKGMLSAAVQGSAIFERVLRDLRNAGGTDNYELVALSPPEKARGSSVRPREFIVRAEEHGIPQARHRVIIVGIRRDVARNLTVEDYPTLLRSERGTNVSQVLGGMPRLRSGLSSGDSLPAWMDALRGALQRIASSIDELPNGGAEQIKAELDHVRSSLGAVVARSVSASGNVALPNDCPSDLARWLLDNNVHRLPQHETRGHMPSDLDRYLYAACFARAFGVSPKADDFPRALAPKHQNWESGKFNDRFRVQLADRPSTTVTSHISKDGHYFIHPDPAQCRSLTVREAARLQTFPDNYAFLGNRTEQYVQVGNAVPPFLAKQIADAIAPLFSKIELPPVGVEPTTAELTHVA